MQQNPLECFLLYAVHGVPQNSILESLLYLIEKTHIFSFIIFAVVLPGSVQQVCGFHPLVIEPWQHSSFQRNVEAVASRR